MKKIIRKVKGKKVLSFVLAAIMLATTFSVAVPMLKLDVGAVTSIATTNGETVTQSKIVGDDIRNTIYDNYAAQFLNGASNPTNIVIPGLQDSEDYVIQGMTYYPKKDWMLITAYHGNCDSTDDNPLPVKSSKVFALDAATGKFVAMFDFYNPGTQTLNTEHGGGIAVSENNIYYACGDDDREIAYAPLSELELAPEQTYKTIQLADSADFKEIGSVTKDGKTGYTAYVCYDQGILWTGNFFDEGVEIIGGADWTEIANGYNAPANPKYNSMVFGYRLTENVGSTPEERSANEWNNLMGALGKDCRGNPSYTIGLNNQIRDVQYAVVDNGKLYLSCSYGTGGDNLSVTFAGMNPYSTLVVADIDLTQPGTVSVDLKTHNGTKTVKAYAIDEVKKFNMMPMSEGLCVVNDNLFITFESASRKYRTKDAAGIMGNCDDHVDVVWQVDPYELMETTVAEPEKSIYYEKVYSLTDIKDGDEYIIVHESQEKSKVTQKNYLYALNAKGNFKGLELSKSTATNIKGYDGMIGHPISYYSFEKGLNNEDILYLGQPENDDIENIRWTITKTGEGVYSIKNTSPYFANYNNFYFNQNTITMLPSGSKCLEKLNIIQLDAGSGYFYLRNTIDEGKEYYLWCNDGLNDNYNSKANAYYSKMTDYPLLDGVTETPGTFHCDAKNHSGANILGGQIELSDDTVPYEDHAFQIYRRKVDQAASTYESRVYTDLDAELQADGTYTVTLETFAISPNHYQYKGEKPTDYIIVADTSSSMNEEGSTGYNKYDGDLKVDKLSLKDDTSDDQPEDTVIGYAFSNEDIYFKHAADGKFYKGYMAIRNGHVTKDIGCGMTTEEAIQYYYLYYVADDGFYYCYTNQEATPTLKYTEDQFKAWVAGAEGMPVQTASSTAANNENRRDEELIWGEHYRFDDVNSAKANEHTRLKTLKEATNDLIDDIAAQNSGNRIALVKYGADNSSGFITTSGSLSTNDYTNAFWTTKTVDQLKGCVNALTTSSQTNNDGLEMDYVNALMANSGYDYTAEKRDQNVAVILISDGIPGNDNGKSATAAANKVISKALTAKNNGAFIYTVLVGNASASNFNKKLYMDAVSSKYAAAKSLGEPGGQSVDGVNYAISLATTTMNNYLNFGQMTTEEVAYNASVGLDNLNASSYLREQLSDAFKFPADNADGTKNYSIDVDLITGAYDEVGRFSFEEDTATSDENVTDAAIIKENTEVNTLTKTLEITKYDYAKEYIAKSKPEPGRKLRVKITGLLADEIADIRNTSISNTDTTAIYKNKDNMDHDIAFKQLPTEYFNIPKYTYVLDYGLQMLDTDVNGTLKSVSADLSAQRNANGDLAYKTESENGLVKIQSGNQNLLYNTTPTNMNDSGYVLIQRDNGKYDWFEIKVVPASNVLYEESAITLPDSNTDNKPDWTVTNSAPAIEHQELSSEKDVYGYDKNYATSQNFSNNTYYSTNVDSVNKRSETATFTFKGTGFDLISACGPNTGVQLVNIKRNGTMVRGFIVDTYYDGARASGNDGKFYQVPIVNWDATKEAKITGDKYGEYTVEVTSYYLSSSKAVENHQINQQTRKKIIDTGLVMNYSNANEAYGIEEILADAGISNTDNIDIIWFDDNSILNGGTGASVKKGSRAVDKNGNLILESYIDGIRVYNPVQDTSDYIESEQTPVYYNVIDSLVNGTLTDGTLDFTSGNVAFVTGSLAEGTELTFANYETVGPEGELYLEGGATTDGVVFKTPVASNGRVMVSLRAVNGTTTANINGKEFAINSATEMYYDITDLVKASNGSVNIINKGSGILSINNIKLTNTASTAGLMMLSMDDLETVQYYANAEPVQATVENGVVTPVVEEEEIPEDTTNDSTDTEGGEEEFNIFSFIEMLIAFIEKILYNAFGAGSIA